MKKNLFVLFNDRLLKSVLTTSFIVFLFAGKAQVLYGVTDFGGKYGGGAVFKSDISNSTLTSVVDFPKIVTNGFPSVGPVDGLLLAADGKLYGVTQELGANSDGFIYSYNPANGAYAEIFTFSGANGAGPNGGLTQTADGKLYGVTLGGGTNREGVIYSYDPATSTYNKLKDFNGTDGAYPIGKLTKGADGKLYGITSQGGENQLGIIFSFDPATSIYTKLQEFTLADGAQPVGHLLLASDGKLYGMTNYGGTYQYGVIFSFDPATSTYANLKSLDYNTDGGFPVGGLVQASDGKLYGTMYEGGTYSNGVVFSFDPATATYTKLKDFVDFCDIDGSYPFGTLIQASDGKLYGSTTFGGGNCDGAVFSYDISTATFSKVQDFTSKITGNAPWGYLTEVQGNNSPGISISIADKSILEGASGVKLLNFPVALNKKSSKSVTVSYATKPLTASAGSDFISQSGKLIFPAGVTKLFIAIPVRGDKIYEPSETFNVILSNPVNANLGVSVAIGTIINNNNSQLNATADKLITGKSVQLSPNPATSKANVSLQGYSGNVTILLSTIEGKLLKQDKIKLYSGPAQYQADVSSYPSGSYVITIIDEKGNKQSLKLMVSH